MLEVGLVHVDDSLSVCQNLQELTRINLSLDFAKVRIAVRKTSFRNFVRKVMVVLQRVVSDLLREGSSKLLNRFFVDLVGQDDFFVLCVCFSNNFSNCLLFFLLHNSLLLFLFEELLVKLALSLKL